MRLLPWGGLAATLLVSLAASGFGFLDAAKHHAAAKLAIAMALAVAGSAIVLTVRYLSARPGLRPVETVTTAARRSLAGSTRQMALVPILGILSMAAAMIHDAVIKQHFDEYYLYGLFFVAVGLFQAVWALVVMTRSLRFLYLVGALVNLATAAAWVFTRTVGLLIGPAAHETEKVGFGDILSTVFEVLIVLGCLLMLSRTWRDRPVHPGRGEVMVVLSALALTVVTILGLYSSVGGAPFVTHVG